MTVTLPLRRLAASVRDSVEERLAMGTWRVGLAAVLEAAAVCLADELEASAVGDSA